MWVIAVVAVAPCQCFLAGMVPDHVARANLFFRTTLALHPAAAGRDDQRLAQRMRVPGGASAGLEGYDRTADTRGIAASQRRVDPHGAVK